MTIRAYKSSDSNALSYIFEQAVKSIGSVHYTPEQVQAWDSRIPSPDTLNQSLSDGREVWVWVTDLDIPQAFIDLEPNGHIDLMYAHPSVSRTGATIALYSALENHARDKGIERLYVEASEAAKRFFSKQGFTTLHRRELQIEGVKIHNYAMEKYLK